MSEEILLVFQPDGGAVKNPQMMSAYRKTAQALAEYGTLKFGWWGQIEKGGTDCDEVPPEVTLNAQLLTFAELEAISDQYLKDDWQKRWEDQARLAWERCRRYSPGQITETQFAEAELADVMAADIHALKSGMGTGKTHAIAQLLGQTDQGVVAIGSRNSLLLQSCVRWGGFYHLHEDEAFGLTADPKGRIACCVDSLRHFGDNDFAGKIVIIDECLSVVKHALLSSTLKGKRDKALAKFEQAIRTAAVVIAWDGNNADIAINYLAALRGEHCRVIKALNTYRGDVLDVELVRVLGEEGTVWLSNNKPVLTKVGDALRANRALGTGKGIVVVADNQMLLESMDDVYSEFGYRVLRIDSKTNSTAEMKEILKAPDDYLAENRTDLLLLSPSAESGLDISIKGYFSHGFGLFFGNIDTATQMQILRRVRDCREWTVWCVEYVAAEDVDGSRSPLPRKLHQQMVTYLEADSLASLEGRDSNLTEQFIARLKAELTNIHYQTTLQFMAARNYELQHTRECLQRSLEEAGHQVRLVDVKGSGDSYDTQLLTEAKAAIIEADSNAIYRAQDISSSQAAKIKASFSSTIEERYAAEKAILKARLPGIEHSEHWNPEFIAQVLFKDRGLIRRMERYWLSNNLEAAKVRSAEVYLQALEFGAFLPDIRSDYRLLQAIAHLKLDRLYEDLHDSSSSVIQDIYQKCRTSKRLQAALGRAPGKLSPVDWVSRLCRIVGIESSGQAKPRSQRGEGGARSYIYNPPTADPTLQAMLSCIERRFEKYLPGTSASPEQQGVEADHLSLPFESLAGEGDPPQSKAGEEAYGFDQDLLAEVREMRRQAAEVGPEAVEELRKCFDPDVWEASA